MSTKAKINLSALAREMGVSRKTVHEWKNARAPLHDGKLLRSWLASRGRIAEGVRRATALPAKTPSKPAKPKTPRPASDGIAGAAQALKRLESAELAAFDRMEAATDAGEDSVALAELRKSWLLISESLRKFDLLVEQNRREAGDLIPREALEGAISSFMTASWLASRMQVDGLVNQLSGVSEPWQIGEALTRAADGRWLSAACSMLCGDKSIIGTIKKQIEGNFSISPEQMEARERAVAGMLADLKARS